MRQVNHAHFTPIWRLPSPTRRVLELFQRQRWEICDRPSDRLNYGLFWAQRYYLEQRFKHKNVQTNAFLFWHGHTVCPCYCFRTLVVILFKIFFIYFLSWTELNWNLWVLNPVPTWPGLLQILKLLVCYVPVLHDTCDFSLLLIYQCDQGFAMLLCDCTGLNRDVRVYVSCLFGLNLTSFTFLICWKMLDLWVHVLTRVTGRVDFRRCVCPPDSKIK